MATKLTVQNITDEYNYRFADGLGNTSKRRIAGFKAKAKRLMNKLEDSEQINAIQVILNDIEEKQNGRSSTKKQPVFTVNGNTVTVDKLYNRIIIDSGSSYYGYALVTYLGESEKAEPIGTVNVTDGNDIEEYYIIRYTLNPWWAVFPTGWVTGPLTTLANMEIVTENMDDVLTVGDGPMKRHAKQMGCCYVNSESIDYDFLGTPYPTD